MSCVIKKCDCKHSFQDETYGVGNRVHNVSTKGSNCTVCGKEKTGSDLNSRKK